MIQLTDFLRSLRAVREFERKPVHDEVVQDIPEVARWSGSASNRQFGQIIVVRKRETLNALAGLAGYAGHLRGAALALVLVMPGEWPEGETFDEGRLAERIMLAALAHGVGSSIGWISPEARDDAKRILGVPGKPVVRTAISLGYPTHAPRRGARKPINELVHGERYRGS
ncbi:MAG: nitroreductase family protein [Candidatus Dormibacteraeota bacterium]|nr:nitroreductase family protein [Candidatus Dormibacteraeota bacterium]MDQ6884325.1 nitroreductase family protein [Candidatus Dormibacteraeota bacterium]